MGTINTKVKSPADPCSPGGIFGVYAAAGTTTTNSVTVTVPPQVMIQTLIGEAGSQTADGDQTMPSILAVAAQRFGDSNFPGGSTATWQSVLVPSQFYGAANTTPNGVEPELDFAASGFSGKLVNVLTCETYWSPTDAQWSTLQGWLGQQANAISDEMWASIGAPIVWIGMPKQAVVKDSIANNRRGGYSTAPAIVLFRKAPSPTDPAVINIQ